MKKLLLKLSIIFFFAGVLFVSCEKDEEDESGSITGIVNHSITNEPLEGVNVTLSPNGNSSFTTGTDGKFTFNDLAIGNYQVQAVKDGYETNSKSVTVSLDKVSQADIAIKPIGPEISLSTESLDFGENITNLPIDIHNIGSGELKWSVSENVEWISVNPISGTTLAESDVITIIVDRSSLLQGDYSQNINITSDGGSKTIHISAGVSGPVLTVIPEHLDFGSIESQKSIFISNTGIGTITYSVSSGDNWISYTPESGSLSTQTEAIQVNINRADLSPGAYSGQLLFNTNSNDVVVPISMSIIAPSAPDVSCSATTEVTWGNAEISGNIIDLGSSAVTQHGHCWSLNSNPTIVDNKTTLGSSITVGSFNSSLSGLSSSTMYYIRAYATNDEGTAYSNQISFSTLGTPTLPIVATGSASEITHNSAQINGFLIDLGDGYITQHGFCYSTNTNPSINDAILELGAANATGNIMGELSGLSESTTYYAKAFAINSLGLVYGDMIEFNTEDAPPVVMGGLMHYYTFDGSIEDVVGNNHCIAHGGVYSDDIPSENGQSYSFNSASEEYLQLSGSPINNLNQFSFSCWFKTYNGGGMFGCYASGNGFGDMARVMTIWNNKAHYWIKGSTENYFDYLTNYYTDNNWHMITLTEGDGYKLYLDGVLVETIDNTVTPRVYSSSFIGADGAGRYFHGEIDNMRIYNRALTEAEVAEIYEAIQ